MTIETIYLVAIAHVWSRGTIFRRLREWGEPDTFPRSLLNCPLCSGFWIGVIGFALVHLPGGRAVVEVLGIGSIVGTCSLAVCGLIRRI